MTDIPFDTYLPATQNRDSASPGVLIMTADKVEDLEFFYPYYRFIEAGYRVDVVTPNGGEFKGKQGLSLKSSYQFGDVTPTNYHMLYIPGGKAPTELKSNNDALVLVKFFLKSGKLVSAICHGPQLLAAADVIRGKRISGWPEIAEEVVKAGAVYVSEETVQDGLIITARWPADLPMHMKHTLAALDHATHSEDRSASAAA